MLSAQEALIYTMVMMSASDRNMTDAELDTIGAIVKHLPVFATFPADSLLEVAEACAAKINAPKGVDKVLDEVDRAVPERLRETAYALACEVVAADLAASPEELTMLQYFRRRFHIDRLTAAAIERGARARHIPA
ncbi:MAG: tellurite resistance TerB family protein [Rhodospirillales bacterium]